jgi:ubiquinone/menaquinone biosynthesis C-methylase UbiE
MENRVELEKDFWNSFAKKYDRFILNNVSKTYEILCNNLVRDVSKTGQVLEIATGTGIIAIHLSMHVQSITAIDIAPEMISIAKEKCARQSIHNIDFRIGDSCNLEFPDNTFDTVIASNVLHLLFHPNRALQEMKRVLTSGGRIIIPTYCHGADVKSRVISMLMGLAGFKARTRWSLESFRAFVKENGLIVHNKEIIKDKIPLMYLIAAKE